MRGTTAAPSRKSMLTCYPYRIRCYCLRYDATENWFSHIGHARSERVALPQTLQGRKIDCIFDFREYQLRFTLGDVQLNAVLKLRRETNEKDVERRKRWEQGWCGSFHLTCTFTVSDVLKVRRKG